MKIKMLAILLSITLCITLTGCGSSNSNFLSNNLDSKYNTLGCSLNATQDYDRKGVTMSFAYNWIYDDDQYLQAYEIVVKVDIDPSTYEGNFDEDFEEARKNANKEIERYKNDLTTVSVDVDEKNHSISEIIRYDVTKMTEEDYNNNFEFVDSYSEYFSYQNGKVYFNKNEYVKKIESYSSVHYNCSNKLFR